MAFEGIRNAKLVLTDALIEATQSQQILIERASEKRNDVDGYCHPSKMDMLQVADVVAREKGIERDEVLQAMEQAIQKAGRSKYGHEHDIRATIDRKTGEIRLVRCTTVVEEIEDEFTQITEEQAQSRDPSLKVGDVIDDPLPPSTLAVSPPRPRNKSSSRKSAGPSGNASSRKFKDRVGEIVNGIVKRVEFGNVTVDLGRAEGVIRRDELIPREAFRQGDRVRAYIADVRRNSGARRSSCPAPIRVHESACSARKSLRSMTASSRSARQPAIRGAGPRSP